jgi:hypothetical protein
MTSAPTFDPTLPPSASPQAEHLGNYGPRYSEYATTSAGALA